MTEFRHSQPEDIPQLRQLWKECFGDSDAFLDSFYTLAYSPARSLVLQRNDRILGVAYWFDCAMGSLPLAYVYAVAISPEVQGKGLGSALMEAIHRTLKEKHYSGVLLVPGDEGLRRYYTHFGYRSCSCRPLEVCLPPLTPVSPAEYARLRRILLPENGVIQEKENLAFLSALADFFRAGAGIAALSKQDGSCLELLGVPTPGAQRPYAMGRSLTEIPLPEQIYFSFGFD